MHSIHSLSSNKLTNIRFGFSVHLWININVNVSSVPSNRPVFNYTIFSQQNFFLSDGILSIYLRSLEINGKYYKSIHNSFFLENEKVVIIDYSPKVKEYAVDKYALGLAGGKNDILVDLDARMNMLPFNAPPNTIQLGIKPRSLDIQYQEETYFKINSIISNIGGFFSSLSGIFVFLFGASKIAPWGFMQKRMFTCITCRKGFIRNLAKKYISTSGIPFIENVNEMPVNATLEGRIQIIETMLKEYYIDTDFLELLKKEKLMREVIYTPMDKDVNSSNEIND